MPNSYVLGIDQSTQGTKALLLDSAGQLLDKETLPHRQIIDEQGYVEHDLDEIYANTCAVVGKLLARHPDKEATLRCVGLSVQRETVSAWQRSTLKPIYHAIVWQCPRGAAFTSTPQVQAMAPRVREITGLELSEFFSAAKITWLADHVPAFAQLAAAHDLCVGNMDTFLIHKLTHGKTFATEPSNASRTQLMDIHTVSWSPELCSLFKVPQDALPPILDSDSNFGETDFEGLLPHPIPIHAAIGDSQGALFGQGCLQKGQTKTTYGTGSSIMMCAGAEVPQPEHGVVTSAAWRRQGQMTYVLEGNINYSAGIISYLKDDLKLISDPGETAALAQAAHPQDKTFFIPAFSGLGAPYFNGKVRGALLGMSRVTGRNEIVRAALDSIAYQVTDVLNLIGKSAGAQVTDLRVDGGATRNPYLMQMQADLAGTTIKVPRDAELSGMGAAFMAGIACGVYDTAVLLQDRTAAIFKPAQNDSWRQEHLTAWHQAVQCALSYQA